MQQMELFPLSLYLNERPTLACGALCLKVCHYYTCKIKGPESWRGDFLALFRRDEAFVPKREAQCRREDRPEWEMKFVYLNSSLCLLIVLSAKLNPNTYYPSDYYFKCRKMYGTWRIWAVFVTDLPGSLNCADLLSFDSAKAS